MYGRLPQLATWPANALEVNATQGSLVGLGFTPEAIETNPIVYDMVMYVKKFTDESILISCAQGERVARHGGHPECV